MFKKEQRKRRRKDAGFSLTEVMIAVFIIGLLSTAAIIYAAPFFGQGNITRAKADISTYSQALQAFNGTFGRLPTTDEGLQALKTAPASIDPAMYPPGGFIQKIENDPWGRPYVYRFPAERNAYGFDLYSLGSDGQEGGEGDAADIGNW